MKERRGGVSWDKKCEEQKENIMVEEKKTKVAQKVVELCVEKDMVTFRVQLNDHGSCARRKEARGGRLPR